MKINEIHLNEGIWDSSWIKPKKSDVAPERTEPTMDQQAAVWKNARNPNAPAATTPPADTATPPATTEPATQAPAPVASTTQPATAPADKFVQQLIASYNALTPEEQSALRKEAELAYDTASNTNIVKGTNESLKHQFKKLTNENIQWWLTSKSGRMSSKRLREAAMFELKQRGIIFEAHNERKRN